MKLSQGNIVVHRNHASPFPMYFYALEEHNDPEVEEFPGKEGCWYGFYVLPDFLALQVDPSWKYFHEILLPNGRRFVVDVMLPMYATLDETNVVEVFETAASDQTKIRKRMARWIAGSADDDDLSGEELAFVERPDYLSAFHLTKRAQGLAY